MDTLSPLDNAFLELEDADPHASLAIASLAVFAGPEPSYEEFVTAMSGRLALVPRYRQRVLRLPLDLGPPRWVDDTRFDIRWHVRHTAVPPPGGDAELSRLVARVMSHRLDRDRPLWEYWVISGVVGGRWALLSKVHHCMVDGVSGTDLYRVLLDLTPEPGPAVEDGWIPASPPSRWLLTAGALARLATNPAEQVWSVAAALRAPVRTWRRVADAVTGTAHLAAALRPAARSTLMGSLSAQRRFCWVRASLADVRVIRRALGGSVNDVALAAVTAGFRELLQARGDPVHPRSVRTLVPVSVRPPGGEAVRDNEVSLMLAFLPVHVAEPVARLQAVREHLDTLKHAKEVEAGQAITELARHEAFPLVSLPLRPAFRLPQRNLVTVTTNVPGPRQPLYAVGRRMEAVVPFVPIASTLRVGVAIFSYLDTVTFGLTGDYDGAADLDVLARGIETGLADLLAAARAGGDRKEPAGGASNAS